MRWSPRFRPGLLRSVGKSDTRLLHHTLRSLAWSMLLVTVLTAYSLAGLPGADRQALAQTGGAPAAGPAPAPTTTRDQELQERQLDKLTYEIRLLQQQEQTLSQDRTISERRAIANTLTEFGALAIGFGFLIVVARALDRWHARSARAGQRFDDDGRDAEVTA